MPPVFAAIAAFAATSTFAAVVVNIALRVAFAIGVNLLMKAIAPHPKQGWRGDNLTMSTDGATPRKWRFGQGADAGSGVTGWTWGVNNEYIILFIQVADHKCTSLVGGWWNGKRMTVDPTTGAVAEAKVGSTDYLWLTFYNGDWNQAADSELISVRASWNANDRGRGNAYVKIKARYNEKAHPQGLGGLVGGFLFEVKGQPLYDRRLDSSVGGSGTQRWNDQSTWTYSDNAVVVGEALLRGVRVEDTTGVIGSRTMDTFYGLSLTDSDLTFADNVSAMNSCDEAVTLAVGGTEKRYRCHGGIGCDQPAQTPLDDILASMAGKLVAGTGRWVFRPGVAYTPVRSITDGDLRIDGPREIKDFTPLAEIVNYVGGRFSDPAQMYQGIPLPPRFSLTDEAADGGRKTTTADLNFVTSPTQGQRIHKIIRERYRRQFKAQISLAPENLDLEGADWLTWSSARESWTKTWELASGLPKLDDNTFMLVQLDLTEIDSGVFAWTTADELTYTPASGLLTPSPTATFATGLTVTPTTTRSSTGEVKPALLLHWDQVTDPTAVGVRVQFRIKTPVGSVTDRTFPIQPSLPDTQDQVVDDNIAGGAVYEARNSIVYAPNRDPVWSGWVATTGSAPTSGTTTGSVPATGVIGAGVAPYAQHGAIA